MKKIFSQRHPYASAILFGLLCTFMTALGMAVPQILRLDVNAQIVVTTIFLIISIAIGVFIMKRSRFTLLDYGFRKGKKDATKKLLWYIPLLAIEIVPIAFAGLSSEVTIQQYIILLFFTVAVGFNEEIYFRGLAFKVIEEKGIKKAIIWSSVIFGVLHLANALNGKDALYLVLQMLLALLSGFVLAEIVSVSKSLWIAIIWHTSHDYIANITGEALDVTALIVLAIQVAILLIYAIYIWKVSSTEDMPSFEMSDKRKL